MENATGVGRSAEDLNSPIKSNEEPKNCKYEPDSGITSSSSSINNEEKLSNKSENNTPIGINIIEEDHKEESHETSKLLSGEPEISDETVRQIKYLVIGIW